MKSRKKLEELYQEARNKHNELVEVPEKALQLLSTRDYTEYRQRRTRVFIVVCVLAPIVYTLIAVSSVAAWRLISVLGDRVASYDYQSLFRAIPGLQIGSLVGILSLFTYFALAPPLASKPKKGRFNLLLLPRNTIFEVVEYSSRRFIVAAVLSLWFAVGWLIVTAASFGKLSQDSLVWAFRVWMIPGLMVLSITPAVLLVLAAVVMARNEVRRATTRNTVLRELLKTLQKWPASETGDIMHGDFQHEIAAHLTSTACDIKSLYFARIPNNQSEEWIVQQFKFAADNLMVCASWLYLPESKSVDLVRARVITYCNAFLTGRLQELPREEVAESQGLLLLRPKRRLARTVFQVACALIYCLIPIAAFLLLRNYIAPLSVPDSIWLLVYSLWIALGVYAYLEHTSQKGVSTLVDLVKGIIGR